MGVFASGYHAGDASCSDGGSLVGAVVSLSIGPFAQRGLDEAVRICACMAG
jgi:hypothetical protein